MQGDREKVVLVNPNFRDNPLKGGHNLFFPNLGIDSIYTYLSMRDPNLKIYVIDGTLNNLNNKQIKEKILKFNPGIVGFSVTYASLKDTLDILKELKIEFPGIITVVGGSGAISLKLLKKEETVEGLDYCVIGDGERVFEKIITEGKKQKRTKYLEDRIIDIDFIEFPKRKSVNVEEYISMNRTALRTDRNERYLNIYTSKGCDWHKCIFCTVDRKHRTRDLKKIRKEIKYLIEQFKITKLLICDDNIFSFKNSNRSYDLCDIFQQFPRVKWFAETRIMDFAKNSNFSKKLLRKIKESGCTELGWGVESGSLEILKNLRKGFTPSDAERVIRLSTEAGITSKLFLMYNLPNETRENLDSTLYFLRSVLSRYVINFVKVSEYINIPGSIGWSRGISKINVSQTDLERFKEQFVDICAQNNVLFGFYDWGKYIDGKIK